jgi:Holliday junction resolvase
MFAKRKGYRIERNVKLEFEKKKWRVIRAGGSLGEADLICIKRGKCILLQIKSTTKGRLYYYGFLRKELEKFPFFIVVDFGYGNVRILHPKPKINPRDGIALKDFLGKN